MRIPHPSHATVVAYVALTMAMSGTAYAATGGTFLLGKSNAASSTTTLSDSAGVPLTLNARSGSAPLSTNSATKVGHLNADLLDGLDSAALQHKIASTCKAGTAIRTVTAAGTVTCDKGQALVEVVGGDIDTTAGADTLGFGAATCPAGYVVVGGGFITGDGTTPAASALTEAATPVSFTDTATGKRHEFYAVQLRNLDGTPYTGGGIVTAQCALGSSFDAPTASALKSSRAPHGQASLIAKYRAYR